MRVFEEPILSEYSPDSEGGDYNGTYFDGRPKLSFLSDLASGETETWLEVLTCICGCFGCGSVECYANVQNGRVKWYKFDHSQINEELTGTDWGYSKFKGFEFDLVQYIEALYQLEIDILERLSSAVDS